MAVTPTYFLANITDLCFKEKSYAFDDREKMKLAESCPRIIKVS